MFSTGGGGGGSGWTSKSANFCSNANGWSGGGTSASDKFYKSTVSDSAFDAAFATVPGPGVVRVTTTSFDCAGNWVIYKNGTSAYTYSDNTNGDGILAGSIPATGTNSCSITISSADCSISNPVIRFGSTGDHTAFSNLYIWWESA